MASTLTARQAAARAGLSERTIRRWLAAGKIAGTKAAINRWEIDPAQLPRARPDSDRDQLRDLSARLMIVEQALDALYRAACPQNALRGDSEGLGPVDARLPVPMPPIPPVVPATRPGAALSRRGVARFVARHSSLSAEYVRKDWPLFSSWQDVWNRMQRTTTARSCGDSACSCSGLVTRTD